MPAGHGRGWVSSKPAASAASSIHPQNPDVVLACALGHAYGPQPERGVFRTTDGGKNWERVLFVDENTGCSELAMDPKNPAQAVRRHVADRHQDLGPRERRARQRPVHVERRRHDVDAAARAGAFQPARSARSRSQIAPSNPNRVYALIETGDGIPWKGKETDRGQVWRSDDGGENWRVVSYDRNAMGRAHYYAHIFVAPDNENETYYLTAGYSMSLDGGETLVQQQDARAPGGDHHDMWIDPTQRQPDDRRPRPGLLDLAQPRPHLVSQSTRRTRRCIT